jgi:glutamate synthase (NADPH) large chain
MLKVMAKMGISTLQSYKGAQIFEAVGLNDEVIDRCFAGTASRVQGVDFDVLAEETLRRHALGLSRCARGPTAAVLPNPGEFHWRAEGERHMWDPEAIADLQVAARTGSATPTGGSPSTSTNQDAARRCTLRGLLRSSSRAPTAARFRWTKSSRPARSSSGSAPAR